MTLIPYAGGPKAVKNRREQLIRGSLLSQYETLQKKYAQLRALADSRQDQIRRERGRIARLEETLRLIGGMALDGNPLRPFTHVDGDLGEKIVNAVAESFDKTVTALIGNARTVDLCIPRHAAMFLIKILAGSTDASIGRFLGGRNHATVRNGINKFKRKLASDPVLAQKFTAIKEQFKNAPEA